MELSDFLISFSAVFLSELGDKTMFLTLALSTKYGVLPVLTGIFVGTAIIMVVPVAVGVSLKYLVSEKIILLIGSTIFILSGIYFLYDVLKNEDEDEEEIKKDRFTLPVWLSSALVIILLEFGDKTQIVALGLMAALNKPLLVWFGSTLGMFIADSSSLLLMPILKKVNEKVLNIIMALIFLVVGLAGISKAII